MARQTSSLGEGGLVGGNRIEPPGDAARSQPQRLTAPARVVDSLVGMWNASYLGIKHGTAIQDWFASALEECLSMEESTVTLLRALIRLQPAVVMYITSWRNPCHPQLLSEGTFFGECSRMLSLLKGSISLATESKMDNLITATTTLKTELEGALLRTAVNIGYLPSTVTPVTVSLLSYDVLLMCEHPSALDHRSKWKAVFGTLRAMHLGLRSRIASASTVQDDDATRRGLYDVYAVSSDTALDSIFTDGRDLARLCLAQVQKEDTRNTPHDERKDMSSDAKQAAFNAWLNIFDSENSVINDDFVIMLGELYEVFTRDVPASSGEEHLVLFG